MTKSVFSSRDSSRIFLSHVKEALESISYEDQTIMISGRTMTSDLIQSFLLRKNSEFEEKIFKPIILKESISSEISSPGSGEMTLMLSLLMLEDLLPKIISGKYHGDISSNFSKECDNLIKKIKLSSSLMNKSIFDKIINKKFNNQKSREIIKSAINLAGSSRKIIVEKTNKSDSYIHVNDGYNFSIFPDKNFIKGSWKRDNVNCLIIDGVILEVSEIHHLLTKASETNEPYVLFTRGISPDVKHTIFVNNNRGTIDVVPVEIPISEDTINIFSDLSAVCGCDITSSYKGDLISKSINEKSSNVDRIKIDDTGVSISNNKSEKRVLLQIREILDKKGKTLEPAGRDLLDKRVKCLSSGKVEIKIGYQDQLASPTIIEEMDKFFRSIPSILKFGSIKRTEIDNICNKSSKIDLCVNEYLRKRKITYASSHNLIFSIKKAHSLVTSILSTGCILPCNQS